MPGPLRKLGLFLGVLFLVMFATYQHDFTRDGGETRDETRIGVWFSPWLTFSKFETKDGEPAAPGERPRSFGHSLKWAQHFEFLSWSWPALFAGLVLVGIFRKPGEKNA